VPPHKVSPPEDVSPPYRAFLNVVEFGDLPPGIIASTKGINSSAEPVVVHVPLGTTIRLENYAEAFAAARDRGCPIQFQVVPRTDV
jgi:hypothetical protein